MKRFSSVTAIILISIACYWSFESLMPTYSEGVNISEINFSTDRALAHVKNISKEPHGVGFPGHRKVREYIVTELEKLGLETSLQEGYTDAESGSLSRVTNILAKIKGSENGKALLLLSHYDSSIHSSLGASDAGSGVATILEGVRAFLAENKNPKNDIIILITDAEELGLSGAYLFVKEHKWNKDVGLVLNFEARGSGGPSYMLIETNRGNARLIEEFTKANPKYPVANSLAYSIYKMLPNDTDLTVFREDGDIEGFNFAFIGDHFDYHTANDSFERLDRNTLAHQGTYLMPLLKHFSQADLNNMKSPNDYIYFNAPFFGLISYPYEWIWPMFGLAVLLFIVLLVYGFRNKELKFQGVMKGFLPLFLTLIINGIIGYFCWPVLKWMYPHYKDIVHGFTYNGYTYIAAFTALALGICFFTYKRFKNIETSNLLVAPIFIWLIICALLAVYLPGASFFIIPVFAILASFWVIQNQKVPSVFLMVFLTLPAIFILVPLLKMFPVGLGLKLLIATTILTSLIYILLLPVFNFIRRKKTIALMCFTIFLGSMLVAHFNSGFSKENTKPTSLAYILDADTGKTQWITYENSLSPWTKQYLDKNKKAIEKSNSTSILSRFSTGFTYVSEAPKKEINLMEVQKTRDTIIGENRYLDICITPKRNINRLEIFTNDIPLEKVTANGVQLSDYYIKNRRWGRLINHHVTDNMYTDLELVLPKDKILELFIYEISNDLLMNNKFSIPKRPEDNIPMPSRLNDAIMVTKTLRFE